MNKSFYGWWVTVAAFITFGFAVGLPYYSMPFFYDYYEKAFHWTRPQVTFGFPLAAILTLWVGPILIPRFSPRKLIVAGTGLTFLAFWGFSQMTGSLTWYYFLWFVYTFGYIISGPIPHQIIISQWFRKKRGTAMGIVYVGVGLVSALGTYVVTPLTHSLGFRGSLLVVGCFLFVAWPMAIFVLRDRASDKGQFADGDLVAPAENKLVAKTFGELMAQRSFWLLMIGSFCSIGSIGAINQHMKFVFKDAGFTDQDKLNALWSIASVFIAWSSVSGRLLIGKFADMFPMKYVMTATYFIVAAAIPLLIGVTPSTNPYVFSIVFGFAMGADYMLIPLMAARQFGVNSLARSMAIILPVNTIGQTWVPLGVSLLRAHYGDYHIAMGAVLGLAVIGAVAIALLPKDGADQDMIAEKRIPQATRA